MSTVKFEISLYEYLVFGIRVSLVEYPKLKYYEYVGVRLGGTEYLNNNQQTQDSVPGP
jgi:hypothetical protein